jgi:hypothetical protein
MVKLSIAIIPAAGSKSIFYSNIVDCCGRRLVSTDDQLIAAVFPR